MGSLKSKLLKIMAVSVLVVFALVLLVEAIGQAIALVRPSYDVLFLKPDRVLGWRQVPGLHWTWAGHYWYARNFSVEVQTNHAGFRDLEREYVKPAGEKRVALLGDSFIEAVQVPLEKTAGQLLERRLNAADGLKPGPPQKWEVLNFGISSFGVGQYLLTWEQDARRYAPDYVVVFVAKFILDRTSQKYEPGFLGTGDKQLWIRPTFRVGGDALIREPARDFDEFVREQDSVIENGFGGQRSRRRMTLVTLHYARLLYAALIHWRQHRNDGHIWDGSRSLHPNGPVVHPEVEANILATNLKVLEELGRQAAANHSVLVVVDASQYFGDAADESAALQELCARTRSVYVPFYKDLREAFQKGIPTYWSYDGNLTEEGNALLADALYRSLQEARADH